MQCALRHCGTRIETLPSSARELPASPIDIRFTAPTRMRPILWHVDHESDRPTMTVCLLGRPLSTVTIEIAHPGATRAETEAAAVAEMDAMDRALLEVMAGVNRWPHG